MKGSFTKNDVLQIKQSVRKKSRDWRFIKKAIKQVHSKKNSPISITELGSGTGSLAILTARMGVAKSYNCIDGSNEMLDYIRVEKLPIVKTFHNNLETIKTIPKSDVIIAKYLFHHIKNKTSLLKKSKKSLNNGGVLILIDKFPRWKMSLLIERILHAIKIKFILGKHYYQLESDFEQNLKKLNLKIKEKRTKPGKKLKNFHIRTNFYILEQMHL